MTTGPFYPIPRPALTAHDEKPTTEAVGKQIETVTAGS